MIEAVLETTPELALLALLSRLRSEAEAIGSNDIARAVDSLDDHLRSRRLVVAVVGEHNRGKSTVVNSLIGESWLPTGQNAPALPPVYVAGGAREHVEIVYADGKAIESTRDELLTLSPDDAASVSFARVALPSQDLHGLMLVDTPGLNDPDTSRLAQTVYGLMPQSDLALLVLDSAQALGASEHQLIAQRVATAGLHRLVVILNRDDELENEEDRLAVRDRVARLLSPLLGQEPELLPYAAKSALRAKERHDARLLARSGYPELRALLAECAAARAKILQAAVRRKAATLGTRLLAKLEEPAPLPAANPPFDMSLVDQASTACRSLERIRDTYVLDLQAFTLALRDRLEAETAEVSIADVRQYLPFFIQEQFACFVRQHDDPVREQLQGALRATGVADWPDERLAGITPAPGLHPYIEPDFLDDSVLLTTFMAVIGLAMKPLVAGAVMTIGPILRMLTRSLYDRETKDALLQAAMAATTDAGQAIERQVVATFASALDRINAAVPAPAQYEPPPVDDSARHAARDRVKALLESLAAAGAGGAA